MRRIIRNFRFAPTGPRTTSFSCRRHDEFATRAGPGEIIRVPTARLCLSHEPLAVRTITKISPDLASDGPRRWRTSLPRGTLPRHRRRNTGTRAPLRAIPGRSAARTRIHPASRKTAVRRARQNLWSAGHRRHAWRAMRFLPAIIGRPPTPAPVAIGNLPPIVPPSRTRIGSLPPKALPRAE